MLLLFGLPNMTDEQPGECNQNGGSSFGRLASRDNESPPATDQPNHIIGMCEISIQGTLDMPPHWQAAASAASRSFRHSNVLRTLNPIQTIQLLDESCIRLSHCTSSFHECDGFMTIIQKGGVRHLLERIMRPKSDLRTKWIMHRKKFEMSRLVAVGSKFYISLIEHLQCLQCLQSKFW
jgi:hypothetical protein